jgi:hypothetical protein
LGRSRGAGASKSGDLVIGRSGDLKSKTGAIEPDHWDDSDKVAIDWDVPRESVS